MSKWTCLASKQQADLCLCRTSPNITVNLQSLISTECFNPTRFFLRNHKPLLFPGSGALTVFRRKELWQAEMDELEDVTFHLKTCCCSLNMFHVFSEFKASAEVLNPAAHHELTFKKKHTEKKKKETLLTAEPSCFTKMLEFSHETRANRSFSFTPRHKHLQYVISSFTEVVWRLFAWGSCSGSNSIRLTVTPCWSWRTFILSLFSLGCLFLQISLGKGCRHVGSCSSFLAASARQQLTEWR